MVNKILLIIGLLAVLYSCGGSGSDTPSNPPCVDTTWTPYTSIKPSGTSFTQTSNCGNTRTNTGTMVVTDDNNDDNSNIVFRTDVVSFNASKALI